MVAPSRIHSLETGTARIGLILNPLGGQARKRHHAIKQILTELPDILQWEAINASDFDASVKALIQAKIDWLIIIGGDGTFQGILNRLFAWLSPNQWPVLTIIPGGTTNMTALDLGSRDKPDHILQRLKHYLQQPAPRPAPLLVERPVLCIEQTGHEKVYGMFFGLGMIARGVKFSRSRIKQTGITGNIFTALVVLRSLLGTFLGRPQPEWAPAQITTVDEAGVKHQENYLLVLVSALEQLLMGIRPYWGQESAPLHVTFVRQHSRKFWYSIWPLIAGHGHSLKKEHGYVSYNTQMLELSLEDEYIVDGELFHASRQHGPLRITTSGPITFLVL
ncbi:diacylglycerol kinase family protein [Nitrosomonas sp. Nm132]|uniref:diacylglycerol/lipid kinase family protein n=1 Tax=Nitrosomonas sp. Nm132 TaxID=1881053 RepID=UPI00087FFE76|nr:diacylglycerol kinase family protein [Nitrosomonas sp. Nm132]SDH83404.1 Diacylglycerol kinase family enzyme [Nitrosomonas sp. Nm132]